MSKMLVYFILPKNECFITKPAYLGRAIYSAVAGPLALAAITPEDQWDMSFTDENVEAIDFETKPDLVAISIMTVNAYRGYVIAREFRRQGIPVVLGGVHATFLPYEALRHADAVVIGEAEMIWEKVLSDARDGRLNGIYKADRWFDMKGMKPPKWDLLKRNKYLLADFIQTSRGCPHQCTFCCEKGINGNRYRFRPIEEVIQEMRAIPGREIDLYDVDVFSKPERAYKMMEAMVPLGKTWQGAASSGIADNDALLAMAKKSGCYMLSIGFESLSGQNLKQANKGFNRPEHYKELIRKMHKHGIMVLALTMFGFDSDDESVFEKSVKFWIEAGADAAAFSLLTPYPGTPLFHQLAAEGRITSYDWSKYAQSDVVYQPKLMSQETLRAGLAYAYQTFYSSRSLAHRFPFQGSRNRLYWVVTNALLRKFAKQDAPLNRVVCDDTRPPGNLIADHARPDASGMIRSTQTTKVSRTKKWAWQYGASNRRRVKVPNIKLQKN